ncbi:unnamed protein product [Lota lota]
MTLYYSKVKIDHFKSVIVTKVSRAKSFVRKYRLENNRVNVEHDIVLSIKNDETFEKEYEIDLEEFKKAVANLTRCIKGVAGCPELEITNTSTPTKPADLGNNICARIVSDPALLELYEARYDGGWSCVTVCDTTHTNPKECYHNGVCRVYSIIGPLCECQNIDATWYLGDDCSSPIQKVAFYAGLSATLVVLVLTVGSLTAYLVVNKRRQNRKREIRETLVNEWLEEDVVWPKSSHYHSANSGMYSNPSFSADVNPTSQRDRYLYQISPRGNAAPNAGNQDTAALAFPRNQEALGGRHLNLLSPNPSDSAFPPQNQLLSRNQPMQVGRPQIRSSPNEIRHLELYIST